MRPCRPGPEKHNSLEISYDNHEYLTPEMLFQVLVKLKSFLTIPLQAITIVESVRSDSHFFVLDISVDICLSVIVSISGFGDNLHIDHILF